MKLRLVAVVAGVALASGVIAGFAAPAGVQAPAAAPASNGPGFVRPAQPRIPALEPSEWTDADRETLGPHARGAQTENSAKTCLRHIALCRSWRPTFVVYVNGPTSTLRPRERELLRLRSFFLHHDDFAWNAHWPAPDVRQPRVTQEEVRRITKGPQAQGWSAFEATLLQAVDELQGDRFITDATWNALAERYSDPQLLDLIFVAGHDAMNGMYLNSVAIGLPPEGTAHKLLGEKRLLPRSAVAKQVGGFARPRTPRVQPLDTAQWTDAHRQMLGDWNRGPATSDWLKTCLRNFGLCGSWLPLVRYTTGNRSTLPARDKELLRLRTFFLSRCDFGWSAHVQDGYSRRQGLTDQEMLRVAEGPLAPGWNSFDAALLRAADELHTDRFIQDATWKTLAERYTDQQMLDAVFMVGEDTILSMYLNTVGFPLKSGWTGVPTARTSF